MRRDIFFSNILNYSQLITFLPVAKNDRLRDRKRLDCTTNVSKQALEMFFL
jgi:hypothetical protein